MKSRIVLLNGDIQYIDCKLKKENNKEIFCIEKSVISEDVNYIDFLPDLFNAKAGDTGYYVLPMNCEQGVNLTYFKERENSEYVGNFSQISCYGMKKGENGIFAIVTGMKQDFGLVAGVKDGDYYAYPRFYIDGDGLYEDIRVEFYYLENADYSQMARIYREHQIKTTGCETLEVRTKKDKRLKRAAESMALRIRTAWKPAPSAVENQSLDSEPELTVACDFAKCERIIDEFIEQGVKNVEICLVGWSRMGHDGRYPQIFPVEPLLGGEAGLIKLIKKAKDNNFNIIGHDNSSDAYTVSELWEEEYLLKKKDGSLHKMDIWSSGRAYKICPRRYYELFGADHIKKMSELGFEGIHYSDVITILSLVKCYDKNHAVNKKEAAEWYKKLMLDSRVAFGGFSSESGYDYAIEAVDYALYSTFHVTHDNSMPPIADEPIPFWQIVYHGIVLYNPGTYTLNYPVKKVHNRLKYFEWGGRPLACVNANFASGKQWMGKEDIRSETEEGIINGVRAIKIMEDDYKWLEEVRYAFMDKHTLAENGISQTEYSNGVKIIVDYNTNTVTMNNNGIIKTKHIE